MLQLKKVALGCTALFFLMTGWAGVSWMTRSAPEPIMPAPSALQPTPVGFREISPDSVAELTERPLYFEGRRKKLANPQAKAKQKPNQGKAVEALKDIQLLGVYTTDTTQGIIVKNKDKRMRIEVGERFAGWQVDAVSVDGAMLARGAQMRTLKMEHAYPKNKAPRRTPRKQPAAQQEQADAARQQQQRQQPETQGLPFGQQPAPQSLDSLVPKN